MGATMRAPCRRPTCVQHDLTYVQCGCQGRAMGFDPGAELGPRLRQVREQRGLSARELARRVQCSPSLISQIERGRSAPSVGMLYALATELRTSLDFLFGAQAGPPGGGTATANGEGGVHMRGESEDEMGGGAGGG